MTSENFIEKLKFIAPQLIKVVDWGSRVDTAERWSQYRLLKSTENNGNFRFLVEELKIRLNTTIKIGNFQLYQAKDYGFDETFEEDGFYPFGFYGQDYLFIKLKTGRVEARDLTLTKFYDVAKDEQAFLEAFLVFAKCYAYDLEHYVQNSDFYSSYLSVSIRERRDILTEVLKIVGGKKYRPFWVQVFQAWTDEELKEMEI